MRPYLLITWLLLLCGTMHAQHKAISGKIVNRFNREPVAFASVYWKQAGFGCVSDSNGVFTLRTPVGTDTLVISFVGYATQNLPSAYVLNAPELLVQLETEAPRETAVVKSKFNKGLRWWRALVQHKVANTPRNFSLYYCELYNKMELDICNLDKEQFEKRKLLQPLAFVWNNVDSTSDTHPFIPVFLTEAVSDYYTSANPAKTREDIRALQTNGIKNETVLEYMGGLNQKINAYDDYFIIFGREFISPTSKAGDQYYNYKGADTQTIGGEKYFHLLFTPKHAGENVFSGDCWLHSGTWALQKITLETKDGININFVQRMSLVQEYRRLPGGEWVVAKDKAVVSLSPFSKNKLSFTGRKTWIYSNIRLNQPFIADKLERQTKTEQVTVADSAILAGKAYWAQQRPEALTVNEQHAAHLIDTLRELPAFKRLSNTVTFVVDGHKQYGKIEIGPWYQWFSRNQLENTRLRFDLGTTAAFSENLRLYGYLAYGFRDAKFKGKIAASFSFPGNHRWTIAPSYVHDLDNGRTRFHDEEIATDNLFSQLLRRQHIPQKFLGIDQLKLAITRRFSSDFSVQTHLSRSNYETFHPLPPKQQFSLLTNGEVTNTEAGVLFRYAPGEKTIFTHRNQHKLKSNLPVTELSYSFAIPDMMRSEYHYQKIGINISQQFRLPRWGQVTYMAYGGKIYGKQVPFMLLEIHPGNEIYYYSKDAFNLMNRFEYISDRYAGINLEHNFDKKLLNLLPFMRKSKMRQFWNIKTVWGDLGYSNRLFNRIEFGSYHLRSLKGHTYTELGTGFDNIFRFFRIDAVWRMVPPAVSQPEVPAFGVFGSFKLQF
ncbi:DUF5686 and carboxypeptidase-like regulatory domain-containing protein [Deminuibacter soli]|uniref:Carboxypeptidase-like regulatory domain-containing protein n=1 Tax=Deminuibacter soli TaxID=2291815 RepID=A0A3E1NJB8_9BACT|nr:DUF5686 and carboxypeptidase-like regulatory domain-containing protein [Deminuibacter soli]RFM28030.1 carboxypeptidase-like regulatory domain-containing protein [Deminuibacter soli]